MPDNPGINQRALLELFNIINQRQLDWDYTVVVSVMEVYNENIRDLLAANHTEKMDVKQGPDGVYVPGLTQVSVTCLEEVNEVNPFSISSLDSHVAKYLIGPTPP